MLLERERSGRIGQVVFIYCGRLRRRQRWRIARIGRTGIGSDRWLESELSEALKVKRLFRQIERGYFFDRDPSIACDIGRGASRLVVV